MECIACADEILSEDKWCVCPRCDFGCCRSCLKRYFKELDKYDVTCMSCREKLSRHDLIQMLGEKYYKGAFSAFRKDILFKREQNIRPHQASLYMIMEEEREIAIREATKPIDVEIKKLKCVLVEIYDEMEEFEDDPDFEDEVEKLRKEATKIEIKLRRHIMSKLEARNNMLNPGQNQGNNNNNQNALIERIEAELQEKIKNHDKMENVKCSKKDCKGVMFVEDDNIICSVCESVYCKDCSEEVMDEFHKCDKETLRNMKAIRKDCKQCPNCKFGIYKIQGCDHMWCTNCNTSFSWSNGTIIQRVNFHNPHYTDYVMNLRTDALQEVINDNVLNNVDVIMTPLEYIIVLLRNISNDEIIKFYDNVRQTCNFLAKKRVNDSRDYTENKLTELYIDYSDSLITEEKYKSKVMRIENKYELAKERNEVINECLERVNTAWNLYIQDPQRFDIVDNVMKLFDSLREKDIKIARTYGVYPLNV